ncbi:hypothetical protein HanXRQr2_Chr04g0153051 [Helianthus annuus]|uniref:Uncharacterized protein n=1 Tax=Helianthus annuus TaxID=4232 RepID=A0A251TL90_HELAN|nr:hypothetical protein HanXRQr2_Chr04g0153051 [Helianthus annuus]KAJ0930270.1 hypothetical protein HanPSC8_Chr04g0147411 [Helianthus annuus]
MPCLSHHSLSTPLLTHKVRSSIISNKSHAHTTRSLLHTSNKYEEHGSHSLSPPSPSRLNTDSQEGADCRSSGSLVGSPATPFALILRHCLSVRRTTTTRNVFRTSSHHYNTLRTTNLVGGTCNIAGE